HSRPRGDHLASPVVTSLSHWLTPLLDAETMRGVDRWAIDERGVAGLDLMERAGAGVVRAVESIAADGPVAVVCGKGNNGGDGLVVARLLREAARAVSVVCVADPGQFKGDASTNLERLPGPPPGRPDGGAWDAEPAASGQGGAVPDGEGPLAGAAVIVDALLGTGFEGEPRGALGPGDAPASGGGGHEVRLRSRPRGRRLARAHGRAGDGRAREHARRSRLRN